MGALLSPRARALPSACAKSSSSMSAIRISDSAAPKGQSRAVRNWS